MIKLWADVELKDTIVMAMPKLIGEGFYMCAIHVEYEWKPPRCSSCKFFGHVLDKCPNNIILDVEKNLKNPRQAARGVQVGTKVAFKTLTQVYRPVSNWNNANSNGKKKQVVIASRESTGKGPKSDMFSYEQGSFNSMLNLSSIIFRINIIEIQIIDEKLTLVDNDGKPLPKVVFTRNVDSDSEVEYVVDDHTVFMASTGLKRGADSGMAIYDDLDITIHGRKKK
ncbi:hypothetical protein Tco_1233365 [Tanacetum coccineum]